MIRRFFSLWQQSIVTGLLYEHIDFESIWTFLQGASWISNPSVYCSLQRRQDTKVDFLERSGVARSVRNKKLIA